MRPLERCSLCDLLTNRAGAHEDSNFCPLTEKGPYCDDCHGARNEGMAEALREVKEIEFEDEDGTRWYILNADAVDAKLAELGEP